MIVYIVKASEGSYDDWYEYTLGAYLDKEKAEKHMTKYNDDLKLDIKQFYKCSDCMDGHDIEVAASKCNIATTDDLRVETDEDHTYMFCKKEIDADIFDKHNAKIEELEVVE